MYPVLRFLIILIHLSRQTKSLGVQKTPQIRGNTEHHWKNPSNHQKRWKRSQKLVERNSGVALWRFALQGETRFLTSCSDYCNLTNCGGLDHINAGCFTLRSLTQCVLQSADFIYAPNISFQIGEGWGKLYNSPNSSSSKSWRTTFSRGKLSEDSLIKNQILPASLNLQHKVFHKSAWTEFSSFNTPRLK